MTDAPDLHTGNPDPEDKEQLRNVFQVVVGDARLESQKSGNEIRWMNTVFDEWVWPRLHMWYDKGVVAGRAQATADGRRHEG